MSVTKIVSISGAAFAVALGGWNMILPGKPPIEVHALTYSNGMVTIDRTVRVGGLEADNIARVTWIRQVVDTATGRPVRGCDVAGASSADIGRHEETVPLDQWIGALSCIAGILPEGTYYLREVQSLNNQEQQIPARSDPWEVRR